MEDALNRLDFATHNNVPSTSVLYDNETSKYQSIKNIVENALLINKKREKRKERNTTFRIIFNIQSRKV